MTADNPGEIVPKAQSQGLISPGHRVDRAAGEFRRGAPVIIRDDASASGLAIAAETASSDTLAQAVRLSGPAALLLTHARAATLKIPFYTDDIVRIALRDKVQASEIRAIADPSTDLEHPLKGPFSASRTEPVGSEKAAVTLAKLAGLLPAAVHIPVSEEIRRRLISDHSICEVWTSDIFQFADQAVETLHIVLRAAVPLRNAEETTLVAFRSEYGGPEHYAVIIGAKTSPALATPGPVLTRLHSECFTGDLLASLKCDCGDQLRGAVEKIAREGGGILLYLAQEGRGIGLMNKLRAYRLQDEGFDTLEANQRLGFAADERLYETAARMLRLLGYSKVKLLTNNPDKIRALESSGIEVVERVPHSFPSNDHNRDYLRAKSEKSGHLF